MMRGGGTSRFFSDLSDVSPMPSSPMTMLCDCSNVHSWDSDFPECKGLTGLLAAQSASICVARQMPHHLPGNQRRSPEARPRVMAMQSRCGVVELARSGQVWGCVTDSGCGTVAEGNITIGIA